jgi:C1A family cysteine protease
MNAWRGGIVDVAGQQVVRGQHAVLLVGYVTRAKNLYFIIKNSWGTGWGDAGFGYISYDYVSRHATAAHAL